VGKCDADARKAFSADQVNVFLRDSGEFVKKGLGTSDQARLVFGAFPNVNRPVAETVTARGWVLDNKTVFFKGIQQPEGLAFGQVVQLSEFGQAGVGVVGYGFEKNKAGA
jgi:hypothetical protein